MLPGAGQRIGIKRKGLGISKIWAIEKSSRANPFHMQKSRSECKEVGLLATVQTPAQS
jgi:hypothetical protein